MDISRTSINRLMMIPEARQIINAKFAELHLMFRERLSEIDSQEYFNIIYFPGTEASATDNTEETCSQVQSMVKIVDALDYQKENEEEQVKVFLNYFKNHGAIRRAVLDNFYLRILPYSNIFIE